MLAPQVDMHAVAAFRGVHYDTVRKGWKSWVRELGFPAPVSLRPLRWAGAALEAWEAREQARLQALLCRPVRTTENDVPANENRPDLAPAPPAQRRVDRQRSTLISLMEA